MKEKFIAKSFRTLHEKIHGQLNDKEQGYTMTVPVGEGLFPASLLPRLEIILLDPENMMVAFRKISNPGGKTQKKGKWYIGSTKAAGEKLIAWQERMISLQADGNSWEIKKV